MAEVVDNAIVTQPTVSAEEQNSRLMAAIAFIPLISVLFLIVDTYKKDSFVQFYAWQGIAVFVAELVLGSVVSVLTLGFGACLVTPVTFAITAFGAYKAYMGEYWKLPVVGDWADTQVKNATVPTKA